jgi:hypothetical protein
MAAHMVNILGDLLFDLPVDTTKHQLPSPTDLKRKILVKAKKIQQITESIVAPMLQLVKQPSVNQSSSTNKFSLKKQKLRKKTSQSSQLKLEETKTASGQKSENSPGIKDSIGEDEEAISMAIDHHKRKDSKTKDKSRKAKSISKAEFFEIQSLVKHPASILRKPSIDESESKTEKIKPEPEMISQTFTHQPELSILIMKNDVAEKIVSKFAEAPESEKTVQKSLTEKHIKLEHPHHHTVHFSEPLIEHPNERTNQIFLTEIFMKDPIEVNFELINGDNIALARQSFHSEVDHDHHQPNVKGGNVLETSFKVEKYFSSPKLQKQFSIDEYELPELELVEPIPRSVLLTENFESVVKPIENEISENLVKTKQESTENFESVVKAIEKENFECVVSPKQESTENFENVLKPKQESTENFESVVKTIEIEPICDLNNGHSSFQTKNDAEQNLICDSNTSEQTLDLYGQHPHVNEEREKSSDKEESNEFELKTVVNSDHCSLAIENGQDSNVVTKDNNSFEIEDSKKDEICKEEVETSDNDKDEASKLVLTSSSVSKDDSFEVHEIKADKIDGASELETVKKQMSQKPRKTSSAKSASTSKDNSFDLDEIKKVDESQIKFSLTKKADSMVKESMGQTAAASISRKYKKRETSTLQ